MQSSSLARTLLRVDTQISSAHWLITQLAQFSQAWFMRPVSLKMQHPPAVSRFRNPYSAAKSCNSFCCGSFKFRLLSDSLLSFGCVVLSSCLSVAASRAHASGTLSLGGRKGSLTSTQCMMRFSIMAVCPDLKLIFEKSPRPRSPASLISKIGSVERGVTSSPGVKSSKSFIGSSSSK